MRWQDASPQEAQQCSRHAPRWLGWCRAVAEQHSHSLQQQVRDGDLASLVPAAGSSREQSCKLCAVQCGLHGWHAAHAVQKLRTQTGGSYHASQSLSVITAALSRGCTAMCATEAWPRTQPAASLRRCFHCQSLRKSRAPISTAAAGKACCAELLLDFCFLLCLCRPSDISVAAVANMQNITRCHHANTCVNWLQPQRRV